MLQASRDQAVYWPRKDVRRPSTRPTTRCLTRNITNVCNRIDVVDAWRGKRYLAAGSLGRGQVVTHLGRGTIWPWLTRVGGPGPSLFLI